MIFHTSGCAFSTSSRRITEYGRLRTLSVSCPPSSYPTYPGGAPIRRDTECFSMYSDICLLYTSDAADERSSVDLGGRRIIKKKIQCAYGVDFGNECLLYTSDDDNKRLSVDLV